MYAFLAACLPVAAVYYRKAVRRRRAKELLFGEEGAHGEEVDNVKKLKHVYIALDDVNDFSHQVAGHTKEILRAFKGCILKPMIKRLHFFRELRIYEKMESHGTHWTQSAKAFVSKYCGLIIAGGGGRPGMLPQPTFPDMPPSSPRMALTLKKTDRLFLALEDLTKGFKVPCALDIKMGTQTFEPGASEEKRDREARKCRYQAEVGFRLTGFKVFDTLHGTYAGVGKEFGRGLLPEQAADGLALFFYDGLCLRRDCIAAAIQKLERISLWMKSQRELHFYCSSILIVYDGQRSEPLSETDFIVTRSNPATTGPQYTPSQNDAAGTRHFLYSLPKSFTGRPLPTKNSREGDSGGFRHRDSDETSSLFDSYLKGGSNHTLPINSVSGNSPPDFARKCGDDALLSSNYKPRQLTDREEPRRENLENRRVSHLRLKQLREARLSIPVTDLVEVALIDFAHALPGTGGPDEGYLHGLRSLISKLRFLMTD